MTRHYTIFSRFVIAVLTAYMLIPFSAHAAREDQNKHRGYDTRSLYVPGMGTIYYETGNNDSGNDEEDARSDDPKNTTPQQSVPAASPPEHSATSTPAGTIAPVPQENQPPVPEAPVLPPATAEGRVAPSPTDPLPVISAPVGNLASRVLFRPDISPGAYSNSRLSPMQNAVLLMIAAAFALSGLLLVRARDTATAPERRMPQGYERGKQIPIS